MYKELLEKALQMSHEQQFHLFLALRPRDTVLLDISTFKKYERDCEKLEALEATGVDNWEGYDIAMDKLNKEE